MSNGFLVINPRSGDQSPTAQELRGAAEDLGIDVRVLAEGDDAQELAREAADRGAAALGVAGGDGSLAAVASVALDRDVPFVCVPFGTRNHFARDVGLDRDDPLGALAAFSGSERQVDVGNVGDRLFLNNVSLGLYASLVHDVEHGLRGRLAAGLRLLPAALGRSREPLDLSVELEGRTEHHAAFVVLIGNNRYEIESLRELGERERLDEGVLQAYVVEAGTRRALLGLLAHAAFGQAERAESLVEWSSTRFRLEAAPSKVYAAVDGEPVTLEPPVEFAIRPRALRLLLPAKAA